MAEVQNIDVLAAKLKQLEVTYRQRFKGSVQVGFTQNYALFVHENLEANHPVGQAKYLEQPARELRKTISNDITRAMKGGATLKDALLMAGLRLQRAAQELTPVDTSALKASAFTALEEDAEQVAAETKARSDRLKRS